MTTSQGSRNNHRRSRKDTEEQTDRDSCAKKLSEGQADMRQHAEQYGGTSGVQAHNQDPRCGPKEGLQMAQPNRQAVRGSSGFRIGFYVELDDAMALQTNKVRAWHQIWVRTPAVNKPTRKPKLHNKRAQVDRGEQTSRNPRVQ